MLPLSTIAFSATMLVLSHDNVPVTSCEYLAGNNTLFSEGNAFLKQHRGAVGDIVETTSDGFAVGGLCNLYQYMIESRM